MYKYFASLTCNRCRSRGRQYRGIKALEMFIFLHAIVGENQSKCIKYLSCLIKLLHIKTLLNYTTKQVNILLNL